MDKAILAMIAILTCFLPLVNVAGDDQTPGDDVIETVFYGTITDNVTGESLEGVYINGYDRGYDNYCSDVTDIDGSYYLEFNSGGDYDIYIQKVDYHQEYSTQIIMINEKIQLDFQLDPISYQCEVYGNTEDADTGEPLVGVSVTLYVVTGYDEYGGVELSWGSQINTNEEGKYSFKTEPGEYTLEFGKEGYTAVNQYSWLEPFTLKTGDKLEYNMQMREWAQGIFGKITNENNQAMSGIVVTLDGDHYRLTNVTDDDGYYMIKVPPEQIGEYTLNVYADGYRPYSQRVIINAGEMQEKDIQMQKAYLPDPILRILYLILSMLGLY